LPDTPAPLVAASALVDAHVHLHDCYPPDLFLDHADANFERAERARGWPAVPGVLMLTESEGVDEFGRLAEAARGPGALLGRWALEPTGDAEALSARRGGRILVLVAGRQVVTREGLEVLLLGTRETVPDGAPVREVLAAGARFGALRVIPWGVGKWLGARGRLLSELIAAVPPDDRLFLGDSAGRPFFWGRPRHFDEAARRGWRVLPGSDPLPFPSQVARAGSFGFRVEGPVDVTRPSTSLKAALGTTERGITPYGRPERLLPFLRNQVAMQRRKRARAI
jgi:hypothetical protein